MTNLFSSASDQARRIYEELKRKAAVPQRVNAAATSTQNFASVVKNKLYAAASNFNTKANQITPNFNQAIKRDIPRVKQAANSFFSQPMPSFAVNNPLTPPAIRSQYQTGQKPLPTIKEYFNPDATKFITAGAENPLNPWKGNTLTTQQLLNAKDPAAREQFTNLALDMMTPMAATTRNVSAAAKAKNLNLDDITRGAYRKIKEFQISKLNANMKANIDTHLANKNNFTFPGFTRTVERVGDSLQMQTPVGKKVNILDYLRTPDRVMEKIGLKREADYLRKQWDSYIRELPQEVDKIRLWQKQVPNPESSKRIFQYLDGAKYTKLTFQEKQVATEIQEYLKDWANKLELPQDKRITNYITHIFDKEAKGVEFPEEIAQIIQDKIPGSVYDPFVTKRLGKQGYVEDVWRALNAYVKRASRKYNIDPALEAIRSKGESLEQSQFDYVKSYTDRINLRPEKIDLLIDNFIKSTPIGYRLTERPTAYLSRAGRQWVYRGTLGLNPASAIKNLTQGANTYAKLGERYTVQGYFDLIKKWNSTELQDVGILADSFVQEKQMSVVARGLEKLDPILFSFFNAAEKINRGSAYYGAKAKGLSKGLSEAKAIEYAKKIVRDTQFTFGNIDTPLALQGDLAKTLGQFQSFSLKQGEFLIEMAQKKQWAGLARWMGSSLAMIYFIGDTVGMDVKDIIPTPFIQSSGRFSTPPLLNLPLEIGKAALNTPDKFGNERDLLDKAGDIASAALPFVPGGVQAKKTIQGINAVGMGASTTKTGRVRYPIEQTPGNFIKGALFGQYNFPAAKDYFNEKQTPLGDKASEAYRQASPEGKKQIYEAAQFSREQEAIKTKGKQEVAEIKDKLISLPDAKARSQYLETLTLTNTQKEELIRLKKEHQKEKKLKATDFSRTVSVIETNDAKASFLAKQFTGKSEKEVKMLLQQLKDAGLLTDDLKKKLRALKKKKNYGNN